MYGITEECKVVDALAVRKRPPYDYGDLEELIAEALGLTNAQLYGPEPLGSGSVPVEF